MHTAARPPEGSNRLRRLGALLGGAAGLALLGYVAYAANAWYRYGQIASDVRAADATDPVDDFMPSYELEERHATEVNAPADRTFAAARAMDINQAPMARAIFALRTLPTRLRGHATPRVSRSLVDETQAIGWRILVEVPGRTLVMGAYTRPWEPEVIFHGLPPAEFVEFEEPGWAKIVWTLEVEPLGPHRSRFVTRTRVHTTDAVARERFRRYWAALSPGILLIRRASLSLVKNEAERPPSAAEATSSTP
jgi:hypothetical protein